MIFWLFFPQCAHWNAWAMMVTEYWLSKYWQWLTSRWSKHQKTVLHTFHWQWLGCGRAGAGSFKGYVMLINSAEDAFTKWLNETGVSWLSWQWQAPNYMYEIRKGLIVDRAGGWLTFVRSVTILPRLKFVVVVKKEGSPVCQIRAHKSSMFHFSRNGHVVHPFMFENSYNKYTLRCKFQW
jgi:hypothetical protein